MENPEFGRCISYWKRSIFIAIVCEINACPGRGFGDKTSRTFKQTSKNESHWILMIPYDQRQNFSSYLHWLFTRVLMKDILHHVGCLNPVNSEIHCSLSGAVFSINRSMINVLRLSKHSMVYLMAMPGLPLGCFHVGALSYQKSKQLVPTSRLTIKVRYKMSHAIPE